MNKMEPNGHTGASCYAKQLSCLASQGLFLRSSNVTTFERSRTFSEARLSHSSTGKAHGLPIPRRMILEVAVPISFALNEEFDYWAPASCQPISVGCRVLVPFRSRLVLGYVIGTKKHSIFEKKLKPIIKNLDPAPLISAELLELADKIHRDYFCSLAEAIDATLPIGLKKARKAIRDKKELVKQNIVPFNFSAEENEILANGNTQAPVVLVHDLSNTKRWTIYSSLIKKTLNAKKSVIFLVPDHGKIASALKYLGLNLVPRVITSGESPISSLETWQGINEEGFSFVIGTRSAVFAPVNNLGAIFIEEEEHFAYRQDQVPHYRALDIAFQRTRDHQAQIILGSFTPSLDSYWLINRLKGCYWKIESKTAPARVRLIDMRQEVRFKGRKKTISKILEYRLASLLEKKEKVLIFVNQKGFSTFLYCQRCKKTQTCPSCSSSLKYYFKEKLVSCPTCSYQAKSFDICPQCKSAYVRYAGYGVEKVESELLRLFPSLKIFTYEKGKAALDSYDIMLTTQQFLEDPSWSSYAFDSVAVVACDQMLGHVDFRSTERAFAKLLKLSSLARSEVYLQTYMADHLALNFLVNNDVDGFFKNELSQREELNLPPLTEMAVLMIRSHNQAKTQQVAQAFYKKLKKKCVWKNGFLLSEPVASIPFRVRQNYRYQIHIKYKDLKPVRKNILAMMKDRPKGVIVTFDPSVA
jgi:primosomal protein N'